MKSRLRMRLRISAYSIIFFLTSTACILFALNMEQSNAATAKANKDNLSIESCGNHLISFRAEVLDHAVQVEWNTQKESGNNNFKLFRSQDGQVYFELAQIKSIRSDEPCPRYTFSDQNAPNGINYYRLSQVDQDGVLRVYEPIAIVTDKNRKPLLKKDQLLHTLNNNIN